MDDRELLRMAAKAAGYWSDEFDCPDKLPHPGWNPIYSDADALRLAVKLSMDITRGFHGDGGVVIAQHAGIMIVEALGEDWITATRRAIVMCASAIGMTKREVVAVRVEIREWTPPIGISAKELE